MKNKCICEERISKSEAYDVLFFCQLRTSRRERRSENREETGGYFDIYQKEEFLRKDCKGFSIQTAK